MLTNPIYELERMRYLLDDLFSSSLRNEKDDSSLEYADIFENDNGYMLQFLCPGVKKEDVGINFSNGILSIGIKRELEHNENKETRLLRRERSGADYTRSYRISDDADVDKIDAKVLNGILMIFVPRKEKSKPKKIEVKVN